MAYMHDPTAEAIALNALDVSLYRTKLSVWSGFRGKNAPGIGNRFPRYCCRYIERRQFRAVINHGFSKAICDALKHAFSALQNLLRKIRWPFPAAP